MKKTKVSRLTVEGKYSHRIQVETHMDKFTIPVVDVRDGEKERKAAKAIIKSSNISKGSKYITPSFSLLGYSYNHSMKS